jgi:ABC-type transport system involved in cytochrome bd biosynthesis fused ATPase/permease subunit
MFKRSIITWATGWIGVAVAIITLVASGWKAALIVLAVALVLVVVQVVLIASTAAKQIKTELNRQVGTGSGFLR